MQIIESDEQFEIDDQKAIYPSELGIPSLDKNNMDSLPKKSK